MIKRTPQIITRSYHLMDLLDGIVRERNLVVDTIALLFCPPVSNRRPLQRVERGGGGGKK